MSVSKELRSNLVAVSLNLENSRPSAEVSKKQSLEADVIPYDVSENPVLSFSGNEVNLTFKIPRKAFLKIATDAIKHLKREGEDSLPENNNGTDLVSNSDSIGNNSDSNSTDEFVDATKDNGSQENLGCETVEELNYETRSVENHSSKKARIENMLETSEVPSERETSESIANDIPNLLHTDSILDKAEIKTSDLNESNLYDAPESKCQKLENTWPEMHPFRTAETIHISELKSLTIADVLTKYFKIELVDCVIIIKVSGDSKDFNLDVKKYEVKTSSDTDFQSTVNDQMNNSTQEEIRLTIPEDSALKSSESDVNMNLFTSEDECSGQCVKEEILRQSFTEELSKSACATSNGLETSKSPEPSKTVMKDNLCNKTTGGIMDKLIKDETNSEEAANNQLDSSTDSAMKYDNTKCVGASTISYLDSSFTLYNPISSRQQTEDDEDVVDESVPDSAFDSCTIDVEEIDSGASEQSRSKISSQSLYELKILPISPEVLNNIDNLLYEKALKISKTVLRRNNKDLPSTDVVLKIAEDSNEENCISDKITFQTRLPVSTNIRNEYVNPENECSVDVQSKEKTAERNMNNSVTLAVDKHLQKDVDVEEKTLKKSPMGCKINELNAGGVKSTGFVSGKVATEITEEPTDQNSKVFSGPLESSPSETKITITENLLKKQLKIESLNEKSKTVEEITYCENTVDSLPKSKLNESIKVGKNVSSISTIENSDSIFITISEDIVSNSKSIPLNEFKENPENDILKHSTSIKTSDNVGNETSAMKISEFAQQTGGETRLVKFSSVISKAHSQKEVIVEDQGTKLSRLSIEKGDNFSKIKEASPEKAPGSLESHHCISAIQRGLEIKLPIDDKNEHETFAETKFVKCPKIKVYSTTDVYLRDEEDCEKEILKCELPDACNSEYRPAGSSLQMYEKEYGNGSDAITKNDYESDENMSVPSECEGNKVSKSREKTPSDIDEPDSAPTRVRARRADGKKHRTKLSSDKIPENDKNAKIASLGSKYRIKSSRDSTPENDKSTKVASRNSKLVASASKSSEKVSPIMRSLRSKSKEKAEGVENTKKRAFILEIKSKNDIKVDARSSPKKLTKNGSNSETKVAENRSKAGNSRQKALFNLDASSPYTGTRRKKRDKE